MLKFFGVRGAILLRSVGSSLLIVVVAGCGTDRPAAVRPSTTRPSVAAPSTTSTADPGSSLIPRVERKKFLGALKAIDGELIADREVALRRAVEVCFQVYDGKPDDAVRAYAGQAYSSATVSVSRAQAGAIVAKIKKWICSDGAVHRRWES